MKLRYLFVALVAVFALAACEHPDSSEEVPYYWTDNICYIGGPSVSQAIAHSPNGLSGDVDTLYTLPINLKRAEEVDVTAYLEVTTDSDVLTADYIALGSSAVVIPAGQTSVTTTVGISDYTILSNTLDAVDAVVTVKIVDAENATAAQELNTFTLSVSKDEYTCTTYSSTAPSGSALDMTGWTVTNLNTGEDVTEALTDGKATSTGYIIADSNDGTLYILIDMAQSHNVTCFMNQTMSGMYNPTVYTFEYSSDGSNWEVWQKNFVCSGNNSKRYFTFIGGGFDCRYLRVTMSTTPTGNYAPRSYEINVFGE